MIIEEPSIHSLLIIVAQESLFYGSILVWLVHKLFENRVVLA